jgi:hypothetical protein
MRLSPTSKEQPNINCILPEHDVILGKDKFLFLYQGGHNVYDFASGKRIPSPLSIQSFRSNIAARSSYLYRKGIKYVHLAMPDKQTALADYYILDKPSCHNQTFLKDQETNPSFSYIDLTYYIVSLGSSAWLKGDTHLQGVASHAVASHVEKTINNTSDTEIDAHSSATQTLVNGHVGDLSSKLVNTPYFFTETKYGFRRPWIAKTYQNSIPGGNNGLIDIHRCKPEKQEKPRLLFFGDSFGREVAWYMSSFYSITMFCRTPFLHYEIVAAYRPDVVITQSIERYLPSTEPDISAPNFLLYSRIGRHYGKENGDVAFFHALNNCLCGILPNQC